MSGLKRLQMTVLGCGYNYVCVYVGASVCSLCLCEFDIIILDNPTDFKFIINS